MENKFVLDKEKGLFYGDEYLCGYIEVIAFIRDSEEKNWKRRLIFKGFGDQIHILDAKLEMFEKAQDLWGTLIHEGFEVPKSKNKPLVLQYLKSVIPDLKITSVSKMGWITDNQFICPSFCVTREKTDKQFLLDSNVTNLGFEKKGDLKGWQDNVCRYAKNNDMLILSSCASFAGPLLKFINQPCVALNFVGKSSTGKTTNLIFASSTWGNPQQYKKQWRATANAIDTIAESYNDCLLVLDELSQFSGKDVGETVYNLGNGRGKARLNRDAEAKGIKEWRISVISSGEVGMVDKLAENKEKAKAGQLVRFIDVDAEVPDGYGIYNDLHGFKDGATLSNTLKENCSQYYGVAGEAYIKDLVHTDNLEEVIEKYYKIARQDFYTRFKLDNAHGQVKRVADTFAVYLLGGSLAQKFGIIPSDINVATALFNVFERWLKDRGSKTESFEEKDIIDSVLSFLIRHDARFVRLRSVEGWHTEDDKTIINCLGGIEDKGSYRIYYVVPESFRDEICAGKSARLYRKILREKGILLTYKDGSDRRYTINGERPKMTTLAFTKS